MKVIQKSSTLTKSISSPNINSAKKLGWENGSIYNGCVNMDKLKYNIEKMDDISIFPELGASPSFTSANYLQLEFSNRPCSEIEKKNLWEPSRKPLNTSQTIINRTSKPYLRSNLNKLNESKVVEKDENSLPNINIVDLVGSLKNNLITAIPSSSIISSTPILNSIKSSSDDLKNSNTSAVEKNRSLSNLAKAKNITTNIAFGVAVYDYEADCDSDLELTKGQLVIVVKRDESGWWEGFHYKPVRSDKLGVFPNNYVEILSNNDPLLKSPSIQLPSSLTKQLQLAQTVQQQQQPQQVVQQAQQLQQPPQSPRLPAPKSSNTITSSASYSNRNLKTSTSSFSSISPISTSLSISLINKQIKGTPIVQKVDPMVPHLKVFIPPFMEFIMVPYTPKDTLRDVAQKIIRNNNLLRDSLCQFKYPIIKPVVQSPYGKLVSPQQQQPQYLQLSQNVESLRDPDTLGVKLLISGMDYIERVNNSISSTKLLNQFYLNYNPLDCYWLQYDQVSIQIKKNPDGPPLRVIGLNFLDVESISCDKHYSFSLSTLFKEDFIFSTDMPSIVKLWVDTIQQSLQFITYKYGPYYHSCPLTPTSDYSSSISFSSSSSSSFLLSSSEFDQIRRQKCNSKCADCSSDQPEWASLQFGIFLCDTCSDIHQEHLKNPDSLGVISSLLDEPTIWSDYIQFFKKLGNVNSNNFWESNLPVHIKKPQPTSSKQEKIQFFILKYIDKSFIPI